MFTAEELHQAQHGEFIKVAEDVYQRWNPLTQIRTTVRYFDEGGKRMMHVRHEQPRSFVTSIIDRNVEMQNSWKGRYGNDVVTQQTCLPMSVHGQIMQQCGFQAGVGYDEKKFRQIINDRDNYKLKTVAGNI